MYIYMTSFFSIYISTLILPDSIQDKLMIIFCKAVFHTATLVHVYAFCAILLHTTVGGWFWLQSLYQSVLCLQWPH